MNNNFWIIIIIATIGIWCLWAIFKHMKEGFGTYNLKVYGLTLIVIVSAILALSCIQLEKLTICTNILAAFAGYLFGLKGNNSIKKDNNE